MDQRSIIALDVAERFANGEATEAERAAAWDAARAAARAAAWATAWDAAWDAQKAKLIEMIEAEGRENIEKKTAKPKTNAAQVAETPLR
jgi:hypothetical protein